MDQLHKQDFAFRKGSFGMLCEHIFILMQVQQQGFTYQFILTPLHFICPQFISLHCYISVSIYHILQLHIFHNVSVIIPLMIWVFICYIVYVGVSTLQPMILLEIPLQLWHWKVELMYIERFPTFSFAINRDKWILSSPYMIFGPWRMLSLLILLVQIWCNML